MKKSTAYKTLTALKKLEDIDVRLAERFLNRRNLTDVELKKITEALESSIHGRCICEETGKPLKLKYNTELVGILNIMAHNRIRSRNEEV